MKFTRTRPAILTNNQRSPVRIRLPAPNSSETLVFGEFFLLNASLAAERLSQRNGNKIEIVSLPQISCFHVRPTFDPHGNTKRKAPELFQCFLCFFCWVLHDLCYEAAHLFGGFFLHSAGGVSVGAQSEAGVVVAQHTGNRFYVHAVLECHGCECMPLRYNYDKPEKPRISRVFGYQARFFILFQPEKSSREVVIS